MASSALEFIKSAGLLRGVAQDRVQAEEFSRGVEKNKGNSLKGSSRQGAGIGAKHMLSTPLGLTTVGLGALSGGLSGAGKSKKNIAARAALGAAVPVALGTAAGATAGHVAKREGEKVRAMTHEDRVQYFQRKGAKA